MEKGINLMEKQEQLFTERELFEAQTPETLVAMQLEAQQRIQSLIGQVALIRDVLDAYGIAQPAIDIPRKVEA